MEWYLLLQKEEADRTSFRQTHPDVFRLTGQSHCCYRRPCPHGWCRNNEPTDHCHHGRYWYCYRCSLFYPAVFVRWVSILNQVTERNSPVGNVFFESLRRNDRAAANRCAHTHTHTRIQKGLYGSFRLCALLFLMCTPLTRLFRSLLTCEEGTRDQPQLVLRRATRDVGHEQTKR